MKHSDTPNIESIFPNVDTAELQERIRTLAYQKYDQRGREDGHDIDDWLQAEAEVTSTKTRRVAA